MRKVLIQAFSGILLGLGLVFITMFSLNPATETKIAGFVLIGIGGLVGLSSFLACFLFFAQELFFSHQFDKKLFYKSWRWGVFISLWVLGFFILKIMDLFDWMILLGVALFFIFLEFSFFRKIN